MKRKAVKRTSLYGVKLLFSWEMKRKSAVFTMEERVLLFRCADEEELSRMVEHASKEYCRDDPQANFVIRRVSSKFILFRIDATDHQDNPLEVYSNLHHGRRSKAKFIENHLRLWS